MNMINKLLTAFFFVSLFAGCAQIKPEYDSKGRLEKVSSFKTPLMGDLSFESEETTTNPKTGEITANKVKTSTSTNADKIIDSAVKGLGTAVNAVEKAGAAVP